MREINSTFSSSKYEGERWSKMTTEEKVAASATQSTHGRKKGALEITEKGGTQRYKKLGLRK